jgi:glycosyltransferase involved in cell wall biosynthesis
VIRNGVAAAPADPPSRAERIDVLRALGLPDRTFMAISVGRLSREKAHAELIPVAAEAAERFPHIHFVIAGEGDERPALEQAIHERGLEATVHLIGHRNDIGRLFRAADVFVFPSHFEGSPLALLEAAAHAVPIVSADFEGAREVVTHGDTGLLHEPGDPQALWQRLEYAVQNPAEMRTMGENARRAVADFSEEEMVNSTLTLLADAAGSAFPAAPAAAPRGPA